MEVEGLLNDLEPDETVIWKGAEYLREYLEPLSQYTVSGFQRVLEDSAAELLARRLEEYGQARPVLVTADRTVVARQHLVDAAALLGWTHIATRLEDSELALTSLDQLSLVDELERSGSNDHSVATLARRQVGEVSEDEIETINSASSDAEREWIGLPEFVRISDPLKVVISCSSEDEREALFDLLGIRTIHKGTRGTLSVWWPDRAREDLSSLRFDVDV